MLEADEEVTVYEPLAGHRSTTVDPEVVSTLEFASETAHDWRVGRGRPVEPAWPVSEPYYGSRAGEARSRTRAPPKALERRQLIVELRRPRRGSEPATDQTARARAGSGWDDHGSDDHGGDD